MIRLLLAFLLPFPIGIAMAAPVLLVNPGFESTKPGVRGNPEGWVTLQHAGPVSYTFTLDTEIRHGGLRGLRIDNIGPEPFGALFQQVPATNLRGKTVRLVAWLRTRDVVGSALGGGAAITLQAMQAGAVLAYNHMSKTPVKGTTDWARQEITLDIPANAEQLEVGAMLQGPGSLWLDDVELAVAER